MPSLLLLICIALSQLFIVVNLPAEYVDFDPIVLFTGNLQMIGIIWLYQVSNKYYKF